MAAERWDLYDGDRKPLGRTHERDADMEPGEYHIVVEIWTVNGKGEILLTLRHPDKELYPNKWESTCGSALAGETVPQAAVRELYEETGISAAERELVYLGSYTEPAISAFVDTFVLRRDAELSELVMQPGETTEAKWATMDELDRMINDESLVLPVGRRLNARRAEFDRLLGVLNQAK